MSLTKPSRATTFLPALMGALAALAAVAAPRASATGLAGGFASNFKSGRGGFTAVDAATGKVLWQHKLAGAAALGFEKNPKYQLIAHSLS